MEGVEKNVGGRRKRWGLSQSLQEVGVGLRKTFRFSLFKTGDITSCLCRDRNEPRRVKKMKLKRAYILPASPAPYPSVSRTRC